MISDRVVGGLNSTAVSSFVAVSVRTAKNFKVFFNYMFTDDLCTCTPKELIIKPCRRGLNTCPFSFLFFFFKAKISFLHMISLRGELHCPMRTV